MAFGLNCPGLKLGVEKSGVEKFLFSLGLKSSWLKSQGLNGLGLKLGVEKSRVEMSCNRLTYCGLHIPWGLITKYTFFVKNIYIFHINY